MKKQPKNIEAKRERALVVQSKKIDKGEDMTLKVHNPNNLPTAPITDILPTQHNLKNLSERNYNKLKNTILKRGFSVPVYVWEDQKGIKYLLDGHQRRRVFETEGWDEPVPYLKIPAKDLQEAMGRLLEITSQYGTITQEGIDEFIARYELDEIETYHATSFDTIDMEVPDFNYGSEDQQGRLDKAKPIECPNCGYEFTS